MTVTKPMRKPKPDVAKDKATMEPIDLSGWQKRIDAKHGKKLMALGERMRALRGNPG